MRFNPAVVAFLLWQVVFPLDGTEESCPKFTKEAMNLIPVNDSVNQESGTKAGLGIKGLAYSLKTRTPHNKKQKTIHDKRLHNQYICSYTSENKEVINIAVLKSDKSEPIQGHKQSDMYLPYSTKKEKSSNLVLGGMDDERLTLRPVYIKNTPRDDSIVIREGKLVSINPGWSDWMACDQTNTLVHIPYPVLCYLKPGLDLPYGCYRVELHLRYELFTPITAAILAIPGCVSLVAFAWLWRHYTKKSKKEKEAEAIQLANLRSLRR